MHPLHTSRLFLHCCCTTTTALTPALHLHCLPALPASACLPLSAHHHTAPASRICTCCTSARASSHCSPFRRGGPQPSVRRTCLHRRAPSLLRKSRTSARKLEGGAIYQARGRPLPLPLFLHCTYLLQGITITCTALWALLRPTWEGHPLHLCTCTLQERRRQRHYATTGGLRLPLLLKISAWGSKGRLLLPNAPCAFQGQEAVSTNVQRRC